MNKQSIRAELERPSIRQFMLENRKYLTGNVLDFGCGDMPYKEIVSGDYTGWDKKMTSRCPEGPFDAIMLNQVIQYFEKPDSQLQYLWTLLKKGGHILITYPTHWEEVEHDDFWRFTYAGMNRLLRSCGFEPVVHDLRCKINFDDFHLAIGYGVVAKKL